MFCHYSWVIKITWKISSLHSQRVAQNSLHLCYRGIFYLIFTQRATTFCLNLKTSVLEKCSSLDQGCWQQTLLFLLQANGQKQPTANNEQRFGTASDISENMTQTRGTSVEGIFAKKKTQLTYIWNRLKWLQDRLCMRRRHRNSILWSTLTVGCRKRLADIIQPPTLSARIHLLISPRKTRKFSLRTALPRNRTSLLPAGLVLMTPFIFFSP